MPTSSGLARNITQCLDDFNIPIYYSTTISEVIGKDRVEGVKVAKVDENLKPIKRTEKLVDCDLVVLSVGLTPEFDIVKNPILNPITNSFLVNEYRECCEGVFACGNVLQVHDLVDNVTAESSIAGRNAGLYALGKLNRSKEKLVTPGDNVRYVVPNSYYLGGGKLEVSFRVTRKVVNCQIIAKCGDKEVFTKNVIALKPSELETIDIDKSLLDGDITICVKERV
jgi:NADPH-dependent 2,4-dienoyl-CoA reductase/sulfur reductase-like enzyme